jgi:DTW domain-containing protein YfiP
VRSRRLTRCDTCGLNRGLCVCATLPELRTRTHIVILTHRVELTKSTNTARLAARMLGDRAQIISSADAPSPSATSPTHRGTWLLFPSEDALPLEDVAAQVASLVVPDGTWTQARRMARRHPLCRDLPRVRLNATAPSSYQLRRAPHPSGLCTLEAIAEALRLLEGDACASQMLESFHEWVERALRLRAGAHNFPAD